MKKVNVTYTAVVGKTLEIPDELYNAYKNWDSLDEASVPFWALWNLFEKDRTLPEIDLCDIQAVEDAESGEYIFEN
jgi:hypothetical protein